MREGSTDTWYLLRQGITRTEGNDKTYQYTAYKREAVPQNKLNPFIRRELWDQDYPTRIPSENNG